jgi:4-hydroxythreonine-4-phosphate dehydrogenase
MKKTTIAMVLGDPAGIGPELIARLLANRKYAVKAHVILIADEAEMRRGMRIAGVEFPYRRVEALESLDFVDDTPLFYDFRGDAVGEFPRSEASVIGGSYSLDTLENCGAPDRSRDHRRHIVRSAEQDLAAHGGHGA